MYPSPGTPINDTNSKIKGMHSKATINYYTSRPQYNLTNSSVIVGTEAASSAIFIFPCFAGRPSQADNILGPDNPTSSIASKGVRPASLGSRPISPGPATFRLSQACSSPRIPASSAHPKPIATFPSRWASLLQPRFTCGLC